MQNLRISLPNERKIDTAASSPAREQNNSKMANQETKSIKQRRATSPSKLRQTSRSPKSRANVKKIIEQAPWKNLDSKKQSQQRTNVMAVVTKTRSTKPSKFEYEPAPSVQQSLSQKSPGLSKHDQTPLTLTQKRSSTGQQDSELYHPMETFGRQFGDQASPLLPNSPISVKMNRSPERIKWDNFQHKLREIRRRSKSRKS